LGGHKVGACKIGTGKSKEGSLQLADLLSRLASANYGHGRIFYPLTHCSLGYKMAAIKNLSAPT